MRILLPFLCAAFVSTARAGEVTALDTEPGIRPGLAITGGAVLGNAWAVSAGLGLSFLIIGNTAGGCPECREIGAPLTVPVAGPFMAAAESDGFGGAVTFSALGLAQTAGLAIGTAGLFRLARDVRARRTWRATHGGG